MPEEEVTKTNIEELTPPKTNFPAKPKSQEIKTTQKIQKKEPIKKEIKSEDKKISQEPIKKTKPQYKYAGKESLSEIIRKFLPKEFIPTKRLGTILGLIFLAVIVLALIMFPFDRLLSGDTNIVIGIGYPWPFLELGIENPKDLPLRPLNLFLDLIIYFVLSYMIDISINFLLSSPLLESKEKKKKKPKVYGFKPTIADKMTKKVFKK